MRTKLFFLFISCSLFGQNAELFNNNWYISQITINGQTTTSPTMSQGLQASEFIQNTSGYTFNSKYFNTAGVNVIFSQTQNSFTKTDGGCTFVDYGGTNWQAAQEYDQKNCNFYVGSFLPAGNVPNGTVFNYEIVNNGASKTLIITNSTTGNKVFYNNAFLGTKENAIKKTFKLYPNPTTDFVIIENVEKNLKLKINDLSGKILFETLTSDKTQKIDVSSFATGQYILSIENFKPEIFIKK
ncbi:T9SS type A sorting domain-containing protein [Chryseobacterium sp. CFBP8996]|uniref:T9SS type A sorting domain-containing protein n=1 Tax=Chryseobacterium sp. CFBP8996 TaxID=3096529 RepID=UPI002A6A8634|nr:T9SS type A sorting domain-containing protein [Chryseobacterium sp. CFBP8996]MDY0931177.1 T9SS type A sorting domain-containing protein [Chryseobacterium sp. CFBP8996]